MRKLIIFLLAIPCIFSLTGCNKHNKNSLEVFVDNLREADGFKVEATMIRERPPKYNYYANIYYNDKKVHVDTNYDIKDYGSDYYFNYENDDTTYVYYEKNGETVKEKINNNLVEVNIKSKISVDDFFLNEDNEYEMTEEALERYDFKSAKISIISKDEAFIKAYVLYNYIEVPVDITIKDINNTSVTLPIE